MEYISFEPEPLHPPMGTAPHILVVGGGVTGLVSSWMLLDQGYRVTILSKEWASYTAKQRLTSQIAGALWEFPPAVCGQHTDPISLQHSKRWSMTAYHIWDAIAADAELSAVSGVRMKKSAFFFPYRLEDNDEQLAKMLEIRDSGVRGFQRSSGLMEHYGVSPDYGCMDAYQLLAPIIDTDHAMEWLMHLTASKGAKFVGETVLSDLFDCERGLLKRFDAQAIVNATGLAGLHLAADQSCYPIRGALLRVINDGSDFAKVDAALSISADVASRVPVDARRESHTPSEIVFIVPRNDRILLVGGISEPHRGSLDHTLESPVIRRMRDRCERFLPRLKSARLDGEYPLAQGLRPFRIGNVRMERELRRHQDDFDGSVNSRIIHSYGQGGAGWSLAFGCAENVLKLVRETLAGESPRPMAFE